MFTFLGITLVVAEHIMTYQSVSQGFYSRWGQLAHLTKLQSFIRKRNRQEKVT